MSTELQAPSRRGPLSGIRVLSLESYLAGNHVTYLLGLYGAEIVKIEQPGVGDALRSPTSSVGHIDNKQHNKKSLALDVRSEEGLGIFLNLVAHADVVFTNQKVSTMRRLGITFDRLKAANDKIVYTTLSGFGHDDLVPEGPFGGWPAFDVVAQGLAGLQFRCLGREDDAPGYNGIALGDDGTAILAAFGTVLALRARDVEDAAQRVDVAMHDAMIYYNGSGVNRMRRHGMAAPRGRSSGGSAPYGPYRTSDGWVNIAVWGDALWRRFCTAVERDDAHADPRFATPAARLSNLAELEDEVVRPFTSSHTSAEVVAALHAQGIPVAPIFDLDEVVASPQVEARKLFTPCHTRDGGMADTLGSPIKASFVDEDQPLAAPPERGEHTNDLLQALIGIDPGSLEKLAAAGVIEDHRASRKD